ncbi:MAG: class I SAM-dependent methyltransferase [Anaerolineae bacterium]|nr:class I SAM-dependent methyltransferase [Anaerolineae bacterium]
MVFTNPMPTEEVYSRFYTDAYSHYYGHITSWPTRAMEPQHVRQWLDALETIRPLNDLRLLEVGPGRGQFLYWARQRGAQVVGIEPSRDFANALAKEGLPCFNDSLEHIGSDRLGRFDVIAMFHVFEHFYDPQIALARIRSLLSARGLLIIEVPNILKPYRSLDHYFLRYVHPTNFSRQTLCGMLAK